jgi:hypothetical protein
LFILSVALCNFSYEDTLKLCLEKGYSNEAIVNLLYDIHGLNISLRTLKRDLQRLGLRRRVAVTAEHLRSAENAIAAELRGPGIVYV